MTNTTEFANGLSVARYHFEKPKDWWSWFNYIPALAGTVVYNAQPLFEFQIQHCTSDALSTLYLNVDGRETVLIKESDLPVLKIEAMVTSWLASLTEWDLSCIVLSNRRLDELERRFESFIQERAKP